MLAAAKSVSAAAGVTRLAELTGLDELGFPIFQAARPLARSLSTSMGRGSSRRAAMVSALLEAIETAVAEDVKPSGDALPLSSLGEAALELWARAPRDPLAIRLDPAVMRHWIDGYRFDSGTVQLVPFDLVSHDLTRPAHPDALRITAGLASGGNRADSLAAAIAELLEHDLEADWRRASPAERRATEIDLASIDDTAVGAAIGRVRSAGCHAWLWSLGQDHDIACFLCVIADGKDAATRLPPVAGAGCHPDRAVAALRALSEAAQARAAMISGARDDLTENAYRDRELRHAEMQLASLSFSAGPLAWSSVPSRPNSAPEDLLEHLAAVARCRTALPLIVVPLAAPHELIDVVKVIAPGLRIAERARIARWREPPHPPSRRRVRSRRRLLFVGPTLWDVAVPSDVERRPPAAAGDLAALLDDPPEAVGLIDGCFETGPSVWHKEILDLIARGVTVFGAASLGALRAAELTSFGMHGVGRVFETYESGSIVRDDAVMLIHAPAELRYRPLTVALVDAEQALKDMQLPNDARRMLQRIVRTLSFRTRTWSLVLDLYRRQARHPIDLDPLAFDEAWSIKRQDALSLVDRMAIELPPSHLQARPPFTTHYRRLLGSVSPMPR